MVSIRFPDDLISFMKSHQEINWAEFVRKEVRKVKEGRHPDIKIKML